MRTRPLPARLLACGALLGVLLTIGGCLNQNNDLSSTETEDRLRGIVERTADLLPDQEWRRSAGEPDEELCGENDRVRFTWSIVADPGTEHLRDAQRVRQKWDDLGMDVRLVEEPNPVVYATGAELERMYFSTGPGLYVIAGTSLCAAEDPHAVERRPTSAH